MKQLIIILFIGLSFSVFGQLKQKMADQLYDRMEYYHCVEMYNELANKTIKGKGVENLENIRRAAIANYKLYNMKNAIHYFSALEKKVKLEEKDQEYLIQALRFANQYNEAEKRIEKAVQSYPENNYFNNLKSQLANFNVLFADSAKAKVNTTGISSQYGDFSPVYYQDGLIYATKSKNTQVLNGRSKWDNSYYVSLLQTPFSVDSTVENGKLLRHQFLDKGHDGPVAFARDQQKMVITKNILGKKKGKDVIVLALYFSEMKEGKWTDLVPFEYNNNEYSVGHACFSDDGNTLYFSSDMEGGFGKTDLYRSYLENGKWSKPENLGEKYNTNMDEMFPFVIGDKLYFSSNGHFGLGGLDLFEVDLTKGDKPVNMGYPINSSADDFGLISQDEEGLKGFISSNREDNIDKIYAFTREKDEFNLLVNIFERYEEDELLPHQSFTFINAKTGESEEYFTNDKGQLNLLLGADETYVLSTQKKDFNLLKTDTVTTVGVDKDDQVIANLVLLPTKITIGLRVIAQDTRLPLDEATVNISDHLTKGSFDTTLVTNDYGLALIEVDRNKDFLAHGSKRGYIAAERGFNTSNENGRIIELELELPPISKGTTFKLDNIFYDFNASTLRSESMRTLDKLAEFLKENNVSIEISANTDSRGSDAYNKRLSQQRAQSCVDYLIKVKGIDPKKIIAKGYGESKPAKIEYNGETVTLNDKFVYGFKDKDVQEEYHQLNRRTEVTILEYDSN